MSVSSVGPVSTAPPPQPQSARRNDQNQNQNTQTTNNTTQSAPSNGTGQVVNKTA